MLFSLSVSGATALVGCGSSSKSSTPAPAPTTTVPTTNGTPGTTGTAVTGSTDGSATATPVGSNSGAPTSPAPAPADCEASWTHYVATHPVGLVMGYKTTQTTKDSAGAVLQSSVSSYEENITESNSTHVVSNRTVNVEGLRRQIVTTTELGKDEFVSGCSRLSGSISGPITGVPADISVQVLERSTQSVTVTAGTFTTDYVRGQATNLSTGQSNFQSWSLQDGSSILVKSVLDTATDVSGASMTGTITTELVKLFRP